MNEKRTECDLADKLALADQRRRDMEVVTNSRDYNREETPRAAPLYPTTRPQSLIKHKSYTSVTQ